MALQTSFTFRFADIEVHEPELRIVCSGECPVHERASVLVNRLYSSSFAGRVMLTMLAVDLVEAWIPVGHALTVDPMILVARRTAGTLKLIPPQTGSPRRCDPESSTPTNAKSAADR